MIPSFSYKNPVKHASSLGFWTFFRVPQVEVALGRLEPPRGCGPAELLQAALRRELLRCLWCAGSFEGGTFSGKREKMGFEGTSDFGFLMVLNCSKCFFILLFWMVFRREFPMVLSVFSGFWIVFEETKITFFLMGFEWISRGFGMGWMDLFQQQNRSSAHSTGGERSNFRVQFHWKPIEIHGICHGICHGKARAPGHPGPGVFDDAWLLRQLPRSPEALLEEAAEEEMLRRENEFLDRYLVRLMKLKRHLTWMKKTAGIHVICYGISLI